MKSFLTTTAMAVGVFSFTSSIALADCTGVGTATITCDGVELNGVDSSIPAKIDVKRDALVSQQTPGLDTIRLRAGGRIETRAATIDNSNGGDTGYAIRSDGPLGINQAGGAITATGSAILAGDNFDFFALGDLTAGKTGIQAGDRTDIDIFGKFTAGDTVLDLGAQANVQAYEDVRSTNGVAISVTTDATIESQNAIVTGKTSGLRIEDGEVYNGGVFSGDEGPGIEILGSGSTVEIDNQGFITTKSNAPGSLALSMDPLSTTSVKLNNDGGAILGGFQLGAGNDVVESHGELIGPMSLGGGDDFFTFYGDLDKAFSGTLVSDVTTSLFPRASDYALGEAIIDGGAGFDVIDFLTLGPGDFELTLETNGFRVTSSATNSETFSILAVGFERVQYQNGGGTFVFDGGVIAPIPLPAGVFLLGGALGALALRRRG